MKSLDVRSSDPNGLPLGTHYRRIIRKGKNGYKDFHKKYFEFMHVVDTEPTVDDYKTGKAKFELIGKFRLANEMPLYYMKLSI